MLPDAAIIYGLVRSPWLIAVLRGIERLNYRLSDAVVAICDGFSRSLESKGQDMSKVAVIPHYVIPPPRDHQVNGFRQGHGIPENVLLAQYAGNLGHSQGLEVILRAAEILRDDRRAHFMIVGEGVAREGLVRGAEQAGLLNVTFLPVQPMERLDELLWAADVCLVTQKANVLDINVPSKIFNIMAHGRPMIAAVNPRSDAATIVRASGGGRVIPPGSAEDLAREIVSMLKLEDRGRGMGFAGKSFAEREYSRARSVAAYEGLLSRVVASGTRRTGCGHA
jgi:colanic acid biosynthesis glycosyl transferase WcaI